jgi:hypothetical protein
VKKLNFLLVCVLFLSIKSYALGYNLCPNPGVAPPEFFNTTKPTQPRCINMKNMTHHCDGSTLELYIKRVKKYNFEKDIYVNNLKNYLDNVLDFIDCEIEQL